MSGTGFTIAFVAAVAAGIVLLKFGTLDPCGIVRYEVRQEALRQGGAGAAVASLLPDAVVDAIVETQYGRLTPGRCVALLFGQTSKAQISTPSPPLRSTPTQTLDNQGQDVPSVPPIAEAPTTPIPPDETRAFALLGQLQAANSSMDKFNLAAERLLNEIPTIENRYRTITERMVAYLARERSLVGISDYRAGVARSQISVTITQGTIAIDQIHIQVQPWQWDFENNIVPLRRAVLALERRCNQVSNSDSQALPQTYAGLSRACTNRAALAPRFMDKYDNLSNGLAHLEEVYQEEHGKQQQIEQISSQLQ